MHKKTTTTTATATSTQTSDTFKLRIVAPQNGSYDGSFILASPNDGTTGALYIISPTSGSDATIWYINSASNKLVVNDARSDYNNFEAASFQNSAQAFYTVLLQASGGNLAGITCSLTPNNEVSCMDSKGNGYFEICYGYLRLTSSPVPSNDSCVTVLLYAVTPS